MRGASLVLLASLAFAVAGCGGDSESAPTEPATTAPTTTAPTTTAPPTTEPKVDEGPLYRKSDLPGLAPRAGDAPAGMTLTKAESGPRTLEEVGIIVESQVAPLRKLGIAGVYDVFFDTASGDRRVATRLWLFRREQGAVGFFQRTRNDSVNHGLQPIGAPPLADESWAAGGILGGVQVISHGFRERNLVVVVSLLSQRDPVSPAQAFAAAKIAAKRAQRA